MSANIPLFQRTFTKEEALNRQNIKVGNDVAPDSVNLEHISIKNAIGKAMTEMTAELDRYKQNRAEKAAPLTR